jgi:hypothetical protein
MDCVFVIVLVAWTRAIDVFPCGFVAERQLVGRHADHRAIVVMDCFNIEEDAAPE